MFNTASEFVISDVIVFQLAAIDSLSSLCDEGDECQARFGLAKSHFVAERPATEHRFHDARPRHEDNLVGLQGRR